MQDPVQRHPTRAEQLDILVTALADLARPGDGVLDLGCGAGYVAHLLEQKRGDLHVTGVDRNADFLAAASAGFADPARFAWIAGDLTRPAELRLPRRNHRFIISCLAFHDLGDADKQGLIGWVAQQLPADGLFLLYDRIRLDRPELFGLQKSIWARLQRRHGVGMREAEDFPAYQADLGSDNAPARLSDYRSWFAAAGLASAILHLHGNIALQAAAPTAAAG